MIDLSACPECGAAIPPDDEHDCDAVCCWDCGLANPGRVFCRACGAWLGASASGPVTPRERRSIHRATSVATPLATARTRARRRGRRLALTATALLVAGVAGVATLASPGARPLVPGGTTGAVPGEALAPAGLAAVVVATPLTTTVAAALQPAAALELAVEAAARSAPATRAPATRAPAAPASAEHEGSAGQPGHAVAEGGWLCGGELSLTAGVEGRWRIGRVIFRAGDGFERLILPLARAGDGGTAASLKARLATGRRGLAIDLAGVSSGLGLRGFRPSGLSLLRSLSVTRAGAARSRIGIATSAPVCARVRVPDWRAGRTGASPVELVVDVRR